MTAIPPASKDYINWLSDHLDAAKVRYEELCRLDDAEEAMGGTSEYYEQAHQMFGYVAALEKCLREAKSFSGDSKTKPLKAPKAPKPARATKLS